MIEEYDKVIIGAGIYGLYSALYCGKKHQRIAVLECDDSAFKRATHINQARVHQGYHYPRSLATASKTAEYFERFNIDYGFCINKEFNQVYATSSQYSWTDGKQFQAFCKAANIPCEELPTNSFFKSNMCDSAFLTKEYTYDSLILKDYFLDELFKMNNVDIFYNAKITQIINDNEHYNIVLENGKTFKTKYVLNSTYSGTNQILEKAGLELLKIKYELCEIILCNVNEKLKEYGITVMDGPFFSIMPFGKTGLHSLTSVTFTPHFSSFSSLPTFECQNKSNGFCSPDYLGNCNDCIARPKTAYPFMRNLTMKYLKDDYVFNYKQSLFSMKPILTSSEIDDSRPTIIKKYTSNPTFISVLSGKINTIYDLNEVLDDGE